ncbi:MAG: hypothetical protein ACLQDL_07670 [Spirochaetia bacterium]
MKIHPLSADPAGVKRRAVRQIFLSAVLLLAIAFPVALSMGNGYRAERSQLLARDLIARAIPDSEILLVASAAGVRGPVLRVTVTSATAVGTVAMDALAKEIVHAGSYYGEAEIIVLRADRFISN